MSKNEDLAKENYILMQKLSLLYEKMASLAKVTKCMNYHPEDAMGGST